jgi:hypothetical protein
LRVRAQGRDGCCFINRGSAGVPLLFTTAINVARLQRERVT